MPETGGAHRQHRSRLWRHWKPSSIKEGRCIGRENWQARSVAMWRFCSSNQTILARCTYSSHCSPNTGTRAGSRTDPKGYRLNPKVAEAHNNLGTALRDLKRRVEAVASYDKAIALNPDYVEAHYNRGNALTDLKRYREAFAAYDMALTLKPDLAAAWGAAPISFIN